MKKILIAFVCIFALLTVTMSFAQTPGTDTFGMLKCKSSGLKSASSIIKTGEAVVCGMKIIPDGTNSCTLILYNNASAGSGDVLDKHVVAAGVGDAGGAAYPFVIPATIGVYATMTTSGTCGYIVWTKEQ